MYYLGTFAGLAGLQLKDFCPDNHGNCRVQMQKMESSQTALVSRSVCVFHVGLSSRFCGAKSTRTFKSVSQCYAQNVPDDDVLDNIRHKQGRTLTSSPKNFIREIR